MLIKKALRKTLAGDDIPRSEITPQAVFENRRRILQAAGAAAAGGLIGAHGLALAAYSSPDPKARKLVAPTNPKFVVPEKVTSFKDITTYNNFYEFGTDKGDPSRNAGTLRPRPWRVSVEGEIRNPKVYDIDELLKLAPLEERVYRLRCVEGWSMVIPWIGVPLAELIKRVEPTGNAKYVQFITLADPSQMTGLSAPILDWPYSEGLRMDEAMNPLTLLTMGVYGQVLPNQNGAPVRVIVPWKYGFKSAKSIVKIRFVEHQPPTSWNTYAPNEYGFYSNVNPNVDHPRWSQATERRIGEDGFFTPKRKTLMFNGYGDWVASMYRGMDLKKYF
ncbi:protein-methionine-sulfoxide reductase catalytic subunit MsrP [Burkholderia oklahomensis]|uniref:Protein-methionine-sulfoxide reductase catalytic subunit MsrP n=1 Tax=Burkholderia oklahomensis TaxID=342113 RepID=A0AAI8B5K4_9BURK|nr:protein-methionine-sulfoxide reductase catalytic subunit MsrP [Burkholderia oklahomensis]AIO65978.1 oxidoreductase molybdopterin binding domain protein [Burkholderia oklahomensis]AJX30707.1 oxidoreductase molybdopterin binding domain protein [Burkholderia oklahomensis C6786]AOI41033.1 sulfoxide reductase catalytic subunit YedY [Burkholderia oklahomensis EO147]AOI44623.1 sulfoxide reductase catalytic subunit YedY [Burkholderia oklahomensis C6786]KUY58081.1 sulfoxide reductase catalytic subun